MTIDAGLDYHELTNINADGAFAGAGRLLDFKHDPENAAFEFKEYSGLERVDLAVGELATGGAPAVEALSRGVAGAGRVDLGAVARLLAYSGGITRIIDRNGQRRYCRAASSAHSYPDLYVICGDMPGLEAGVYYFHSLELELIRLRRGDFRAALARAAADESIRHRPASIVISGIPWRAAWRYRERALRHVYWDTGGLLANLIAVADAGGVDSRVLLGFVDTAVAALTGLDQVHEFPVALATFGSAGDAAPESPPVTPLEVEDPPIAQRAPVLFPVMRDSHRAGDLADAAAVEAWRSGRSAAAAGTRPFPIDRPAVPKPMSMEEVILRRGSTRVMRGDTVPSATLEWALPVAARPMPSDFVDPGVTLLDHFAAVFAVDGVIPGLYRLGAGGVEQLRAGDFRDESRFVSMIQGQGGDGAYATYHCADLPRVAAALGPRGYRAAQLEGGWVLERLHLAAFALGVGATGLTFFDDEVSKLFDTPARVMTEVAVGMGAYRPHTGRLGTEAPRIEGKAIEMLYERLKELRAQRAAAAGRS